MSLPSFTSKDVLILIPAYNEEEIIVQTITSIPLEYEILVINNGSTDNTAEKVRSTRAKLTEESRKGYGQAVYTGVLEGIRMGYSIGVVYDADAANHPQDIKTLVKPICLQTHDLAIAQRTQNAEEGALTSVQVFGNKLSTILIHAITGYHYTDMGSMRAFSLHNLKSLDLEDRGYGWNIEMQIKAVRASWNIVQCELPYRRRQGGESKISGNKRAAMKAGIKILQTALRYAL